nr:MAG TPA: hypothetical protein [Caudoviricetes sp.]
MLGFKILIVKLRGCKPLRTQGRRLRTDKYTSTFSYN